MLHSAVGRTALIAYGSETGNAFDYAEELGRLVERLHFSALVAKLDDVNPSIFAEYSVVIFVVSTTGQGDLPSNARSFWKSLLRKKLANDFLSDVHFTSFGLGDRSYPRFNWAARKFHKRVIQLGGIEFYPRGEGDEQHEEGLDAAFVPWSAGLKECLLSSFALDEGLAPLPNSILLKPKWLLDFATAVSATASTSDYSGERFASEKLTFADQKSNVTNGVQSNQRNPTDSEEKSRFKVTLQENRRLTPESHWQDVRHLVFTAETPISYGPGDVLTIYPRNSNEAVNEFISLMNWTEVADTLVKFLPTGKQVERYAPPPIAILGDGKTTLRYLLTNHLDITAIPRRSFFSLIAHFTEDQFHKERLLEFTDPKLIDELYDYTTRPRRSVLEVLQEFHSVKIPWQWAACVIPELRGRQFSIASGGHLKKSVDGTARFELLVAIVKYKTVIQKVREGVCTKYLAGLKHGSELAVSLQRGGLGISESDFQAPVIMIGPGTGVAPMRSLIWERQLWNEVHSSSHAATERDHALNGDAIRCDSLLIFGSRNRKADFFYENEWEAFQRKGTLRVVTAFSRDQKSKHYVQDTIRETSKEIYQMLHFRNAAVYVCGSSGKMPTAVRAALVDAIRQHGSRATNGNSTHEDSMDQEAALRYLENMERAGRYKQETW